MSRLEEVKQEYKTPKQWAEEGRIICKGATAIALDEEVYENKHAGRSRYDKRHFLKVQTKKPNKGELIDALASYRYYYEARECIGQLGQQIRELARLNKDLRKQNRVLKNQVTNATKQIENLMKRIIRLEKRK